MSTDDDTKPKEALPGLKRLLPTNTSQEARLWAEEAEFHACGFKDAAKFFNEDYYQFNPKQMPVQSQIWRRATPAVVNDDPANNVDAQDAGFHRMINAETASAYTDRLKVHRSDVQTHQNLFYAMVTKLPNHISRDIRNKANETRFINVQDIISYVIEIYDTTSGVSTQDTWMTQYNKLTNKDRQRPSEFTKFYTNQQRLANIYQKLSETYDTPVKEYRDQQLVMMTMQLYRSNLPNHKADSDTPDRFIGIRQNINTSNGKEVYASYSELSREINSAYNVWVNDVGGSNHTDETKNKLFKEKEKKG